MIVMYCDICGQRIDPKFNKRFKLSAYAVKDELEKIYNSDDVCERCINRINNFISEIKAEG